MEPVNDRWLKKGVYSIEVERDKHILYSPPQGLVLLVNTAYRDSLEKAINGCSTARETLGTDDRILAECLGVPDTDKSRIGGFYTHVFKPVSVTLFLTRSCTLRCGYCYASGGIDESMPWEMAKKALEISSENAAEAGEKKFSLNIHGGDVGANWPLFVKTVEYATSLCRELGLTPAVNLGTNGVYDNTQIMYLLDHLDSATVSLDGIPEVHDRYRVLPGGLPSSTAVLETLSAFDRFGFTYAIRMTVLDDSIERLPESIRFIGENCGAKQVKAEPLFQAGRAIRSGLTPPSPSRFVEKFIEAQVVAREFDIQLEYSGSRFGTVASGFCMAAQPIFGVTPSGRVTCCYEMISVDDALSETFLYGRYDHASDSFIINWERITGLRERIQRSIDDCEECFCSWHCAGDCPVKSFQREKRFPTSLPDRCLITRELTRIQLLNALKRGHSIDHQGRGAERQCI